MTLQRGDVVRVDWPYSDRAGSKVRPAVVIQDDPLNRRISDTILVLISRTQRKHSGCRKIYLGFQGARLPSMVVW